ncbi:MAG: phosphatase PAP2 family protein [Acidobacteriota bacterium]|nr:phosphatase PAP2 family protein [Acidobacteriota bacterium]
MRRFGLTPLLVLAAVATAMLVAGRQTPYFPGDVELARAIQSSVPAGGWARAVTRAAYAPWIYGVLAVSAIAALRVAGWRAAVAMAVTFFALMQIEMGMKSFIARPRPSASLVTVAGTTAAPATSMAMMAGAPAAPVSYSMPSGWALLFGSTVGLLGALALRNARGTARAAYLTGCAIILIAGLIARVALGAHWPSDVIAGYLLAITIGLGLVELLATMPGGTSRPTSRGSSRTSAARR